MSAPATARYAELYEMPGPLSSQRMPLEAQDRVRLAHAEGRAPGMETMRFACQGAAVPRGQSLYCGVLKGEQHASWFIAESSTR